MPFSDFISWLDKFEVTKSNVVRSRILNLFEKVKNITNLSSEQILQGIDFDPNDKKREKLESLLSELRAVAFLHNEGFNNIILQPKRDKQKNFDISAVFNDKIFAIEVACLTEEHSRKKESGINAYKIDDSKFIRDLSEKAKIKKLQLDVVNDDCVKMLIFVINRAPELPLYNYDDYKRVLQVLNTNLGWGNGYYLGLINGSEDLVYPKISLIAPEIAGAPSE